MQTLNDIHYGRATFNYISVIIVEVSFIGGGNQRSLRKPPTCRKSLTNFECIFVLTQTIQTTTRVRA